MDLLSTNSLWNVDTDFHLSLLASVAFDSKWLTKFATAFFPALVTTGLLFGVMYVLIMRALKVNRKEVEAWFEHQRQRLQAGPVPVIEKALPVMLAGLYAIYGRSVLRRFVTSLCVGLFFTLLIFATVYSHYKLLSANTREKLAQLEIKADPKLHDYATKPELMPEYKKAFQMILVPYGDRSRWEYLYGGGIYDELRTRHDEYASRLAAEFSANPDRLDLTLLYLMNGSYINPGFQWTDSISLFLFNVLLDFVSVTIAIFCLDLLGRDPRFRKAVVMFFYAVGGTLVCSTIAFLSYRFFFRGNTGFFMQMLVVLPLSLLALLGGVGAILSLFMGEGNNDDMGPLTSLLVGAFFAYLGITGLRYIWSFWSKASLGVINFRDVFSVPYILAATTLVPATLTLLAFGLMLIAKMTAEPARVLPEAYMTFVKEEVGGTQASGVILILGTIAGVIAGLIWAVN